MPVRFLQFGDSALSRVLYLTCLSRFLCLGVAQMIQHFSFAVTMQDGEEHLLRGSKADNIIMWINGIARVSHWFE